MPLNVFGRDEAEYTKDIKAVINEELRDISFRRGEEPVRFDGDWQQECHRRRLFGLSLSGGGIRSATLSLGILQGLAEKGLLQKIDYLSTVSGGGYIGSWLQGLLFRDPIDGYSQLKPKPPDPIAPDPISFL